MARFIPNQKFMSDVEQRIIRGLAVNGDRGSQTAKPLTPVDTSYAQKSVHHVVYSNGSAVAGDTADENGNGLPQYDPDPLIPTVFVGSNTALRPDQFTGGDGYYVGLEMGIYSQKGKHMLATAFSEMQDNIFDDLRDALK